MSAASPQPLTISGKGRSFAIAAARFNGAYVDALLDRCVETLHRAGATDIHVVRVSGSNELPSALDLLAQKKSFDALIALGVLIRGDTIHYEVIANSSAAALQQLSLQRHTPVINGILTVENEAQAKARCAAPHDRGAEFANAALEMAQLAHSVRPTLS